MENSPWLSIWVRPRETIREIVQENPNKSIWLLAAVYGFSSLLNLFQSASLGSFFSPAALVIAAAILSPLWGMIWFSIWSWLVARTGKWFKGEGTYSEIRSAFAWSCVPFVLNIPLWLLMVGIFGAQLFMNFPEGYLLSNGVVTVLFIILIAKVILAVWSLVIYLNALAEVQKLSILKTIFNVIVAGIIISVVLMAIWILILFSFGISIEAPSKTTFLWNEGTSLELLRRGL